MGDILKFRKKVEDKKPKVIGHRISFYTDQEIDLTLMALNTYAWEEVKYTVDTMKCLDPVFIQMCLLKLNESGFLSVYAKQIVKNILNNFEEITEIDYAN